MTVLPWKNWLLACIIKYIHKWYSRIWSTFTRRNWWYKKCCIPSFIRQFKYIHVAEYIYNKHKQKCIRYHKLWWLLKWRLCSCSIWYLLLGLQHTQLTVVLDALNVEVGVVDGKFQVLMTSPHDARASMISAQTSYNALFVHTTHHYVVFALSRHYKKYRGKTRIPKS